MKNRTVKRSILTNNRKALCFKGMKYCLIFNLFLSFSPELIAQIERKSVILEDEQSQVWFSETFSEIEREFESSVRVIDETYSSTLVSSIDLYNKSLINGLQVGIGASFLKDSKNVNKFDTNLSMSNSRSEEKNYLGNSFIEVLKEVGSSLNEDKHFLKFKYITPFGTKEHLFLEERNIIQLSYLFKSIVRKKWKITTEIYARYFGEIKTKKKAIGEEKRESFSEVGFNFHPSFRKGKFSLVPNLGFSFTTDYNTRNQFFTRITDKGFSYSGGLEVQYLAKKYTLSLEYFSSSYVFNTVSDDPSQDIDNEFEKRTVRLGLGVSF